MFQYNQSLCFFQRNCRFCFEVISDIDNAEKLTRESINQWQELMQCDLEITDRFPDLVCMQCSKSVIEFTQFKCKVIETQQKWKTLLSQHVEKLQLTNRSSIIKPEFAKEEIGENKTERIIDKRKVRNKFIKTFDTLKKKGPIEKSKKKPNERK